MKRFLILIAAVSMIAACGDESKSPEQQETVRPAVAREITPDLLYIVTWQGMYLGTYFRMGESSGEIQLPAVFDESVIQDLVLSIYDGGPAGVFATFGAPVGYYEGDIFKDGNAIGLYFIHTDKTPMTLDVDLGYF